MAQLEPRQFTDAETPGPGWKGLCRIGGVAALIALVCFLATMIVVVTLGAEPDTANEYFTLLHNNRLVGLLRLYISDIIGVALFYPMYFGLYAALRRSNGAYAALATAFAFVGVTLWFATHPALSMLHLSDRYAAATTEAQRSQLLAAGEAILASNQYHATGGLIGGLLLEGAAILISVVMLSGKIFSKVTAYAGIAGNGLDLARIMINIFAPGRVDILMAVAGPLMVIWMFLLGRRLYQLGRANPGGSRGQA